MSKQNTFKLIDGNFAPAESREILMNILSSKIQFHQMKNFSSKEQFGKENDIAVKKILLLKKTIEKILKLIDVAQKKQQTLEIKSEVIINLVDAKKNV